MSDSKTTIVLADDHPLILEGLKTYFSSTNYEVVATASDGQTAYNLILQHNPDFAVLDVEMPKLTGIEIAQTIKEKNICVHVVLLTLLKRSTIVDMVGDSIEGYLLKDDAIEELPKCLESIASGHTYTSEKLRSTIFNRSSADYEQLTSSEKKILRLLSQNLSSAQIADRLFLSKRTIEKHRSNIIKKLKLDSRQNALLLWLKDHPEAIE
ncbi:hypothetical protein BST97_05760 [Nonlabens spongiae]|uniref:DNA-binding response regulator n=1 Tax=Nonlabens spongiae TaxID=331648 RepID=A0A1W6MIW1_9FLAO|nr:response regulator transcription factor [Nonlabens spongiae]ARN77530.1 hypothetical protein BST97_05760 [Nonlabens spongiae]